MIKTLEFFGNHPFSGWGGKSLKNTETILQAQFNLLQTVDRAKKTLSIEPVPTVHQAYRDELKKQIISETRSLLGNLSWISEREAKEIMDKFERDVDDYK